MAWATLLLISGLAISVFAGLPWNETMLEEFCKQYTANETKVFLKIMWLSYTTPEYVCRSESKLRNHHGLELK